MILKIFFFFFFIYQLYDVEHPLKLFFILSFVEQASSTQVGHHTGYGIRTRIYFVFVSNWCRFFFVHSVIPPVYRRIGIAHVLIDCILFCPLSVDSATFRPRLWYSLETFTLISSLWKCVDCATLRYLYVSDSCVVHEMSVEEGISFPLMSVAEAHFAGPSSIPMFCSNRLDVFTSDVVACYCYRIFSGHPCISGGWFCVCQSYTRSSDCWVSNWAG